MNLKRKKVPKYWWDFDHQNNVIVETDQDFKIVMCDSIDVAQDLILELTEGRVKWKEVSYHPDPYHEMM